jgi:hypothetical protein
MVSLIHLQAPPQEKFQGPMAPTSQDAFPDHNNAAATQPSSNNSFGFVNMEPIRFTSEIGSPSFFVDEISAFLIPEKRAQEQLTMFRNCFLSVFPFVFIPAETSSSDLRYRRPFLWFVIMSLTTSSLDEISAMGDAIRRIISQTVVAEHVKSLDLLLGLICYIAW